MTNYEKYKDIIDWQARAGGSLAVRESDNTPTMCEEIDCNKCKFDPRTKKSCGLQAIEWLKEYAEPEIEVGDMIEIVNNGCSYTKYADWVVNHVSNKYNMLKYDIGQKPRNGDIGVVREKALHESNGIMLYYIKLESTGRCYLISKDGIKLHRKRSANESNN